MTNDSTKRALIIGISDYDNLAHLSFCKNDGNELYELLISLGYEIASNNKLTGTVKWTEMREAIRKFFTQDVKSKDTLLFYFSGHGIPDDIGDNYLATSEIDPWYPYDKGYPFDEITKMMQRSISNKIVAILDCCYSGAARVSKGHDEVAARLGKTSMHNKSLALEGEGRCILAACQPLQGAYDFKERNQSLFTYYLLDGLHGANGESVDNNGRVTPDSLGRYIYDKVTELLPTQKPIRKIETSGDIVLAYYPQFARTMPENHFARTNLMSHTMESETLHKSGKSVRDKQPEERRRESDIIDAALPVSVTYERAAFIAVVNPSSLIISNTTLSFHPYYVFDYKLRTARIDRAGKSHMIIDEGVRIVDALSGKILYQDLTTSKNQIPDLFSKMSQDPLYKESVLNDMEENTVIHDLLHIKPEFHYEIPRFPNYLLEVLEPILPAKAAKSMILAEIVEDNTKNITYKMKFVNGRTEDREMRVTPKQSEIRITKTALVHLPKWVIIFKAKEVIYTRKIMAASNTILMDELEFCPKHFSRWKVWQGKKPVYAVCDTCGSAYCEDHINKVNETYYCGEHNIRH